MNSRERNRDVLKTLAAKLEARPSDDDVQSASPPLETAPLNNLTEYSPGYSLMNPEPAVNQWHSEIAYNQGIMQDINPSTTENWWNYNTQYAVPEHPMSGDAWTENLGTGSRMF